MRVQVVDPSAFTPPYDHALCAALARAGASVELVTSRFAFGDVPAPDGYAVRELFYRRTFGAPGSRLRRAGKLAAHVPGMLRYRRTAAAADVVHFQWLAMQWLDAHLLPDRPVVLTAHDLLPREPRPGQARAQRQIYDKVDAIVTHSQYGRRQLVEGLGLPPEKVNVIHHGAFEHVAARLSDPTRPSLPPELSDTGEPVVLFFGLLRPYKGIETLLRAWRGIDHAQLWIVGRPMMDLAPLSGLIGPRTRLVARFVSEDEVSALLGRADVVALPYARTERFDQSGVLASALALGKAAVVSDVGGFSEIAATGAARLVAPDDVEQLHDALAELIADPAARERLERGALEAARGDYSWDQAARLTLALYERLRRA
jgi:glycosyltransferase involved in cell wall biosynthesis